LRVISAAIGRRVTLRQLESLLTLGYLHSATETHLLLSHDLLVEALLRERVSTRVAEQYAQKLPRSRALDDIDDQQRASIYYYAGNRYADRSWGAIVRVIRHADETEDYRRVLDVLRLIEKLQARSPAVVSLDYQLAYIIAGSYQHCGNTKVALDRFSALVEQARSQLGIQSSAARRFAECAVEVANQSYLRADVVSGLRFIYQTLEVLEDPEYDFGSDARTSLLCLTRNRCGALLHLSGQDDDAEQEYRRALALAQECGDTYLECHTYTDLATILRFRDLNACAAMIDLSRRMWVDRLTNKVRRRLMIDCATRYTECLQRNTYSSRGKLLGVATEAIEKGFLFQAADAFICQAYSALLQGEWAEAREAAVRALNVTASSDDLRARLYAYHYLTVAEAGLNDIERLLDAQMEAHRLSEKLGFPAAPLLLALASNQNAIENGRVSDVAATPFALV
jgi:tetratricopeptide (TPR) repeat protein